MEPNSETVISPFNRYVKGRTETAGGMADMITNPAWRSGSLIRRVLARRMSPLRKI
jgi:hypothetical protein